MWQLHMTSEAQKWGLVDRFETIREAVRRIIELERTARNGLLRTYVDLPCSDDEALRDLEYKGEKAAYVIRRERPPRLSGRTGDAIRRATGDLSHRCVPGQPARLTVEPADHGAKNDALVRCPRRRSCALGRCP